MIASLEAVGVVDRDTIASLEAVGVVDRGVIADLEADGIVVRDRVANLEIALVSARRIGGAIGLIMALRRVSEAEAFEVLRQASRNRHRKLRDVADDVLLIGRAK
jgi:AmiR/NasT family two-component response regulator